MVFIIIGAVLVLFAVGQAGSAIMEAEKKKTMNEEKMLKINALAAYLRRTTTIPDLMAKSEEELKVFSATLIRQYNEKVRNGTLWGFAIFVVASAFAIWKFGRVENWVPMLLVMAFAYAGGEIFARYEKKRIVNEYAKVGLTKDQLELREPA